MGPRSRNDRRDSERQRKIDAILDAALTLFARKGYEGTTIEDIADELGYAKASLYHYFPGKEAMVKALIYDALDSATERMDALFADPDPRRGLHALVSYYVDDYSQRRGFFNIHHQVGHFMDSILSPEESRAMGLRMAEMNARIVGLLRRGIEAGLWIDEDPQVLAELLLGMISGMMHQVTTSRSQVVLTEQRKASMIAILLKGIQRTQEEP